MKKLLITLLLLGISTSASALDIGRVRQLPSCILAESLNSIEDLERKGWTVGNNPEIVNTPYGKAISYNGVDDYIRSIDKEAITEGTIIYRFKWDSWANYDIMFMYGEDANNTVQGWFHPIEGTIVLSTTNGGGSVNDSTYATTVGTYYNIAYTFKTNEYKLYVNGSQQGATDTSGPMPTINSTFWIGSKFGGYNVVNGPMIEFLVFNRILSATEIDQIYKGTVFSYNDNLVSHWNMSEVNSQNLSYQTDSYPLVGSGIVASTDIVYEDGNWGTEFNGSDERCTVDGISRDRLGNISGMSTVSKVKRNSLGTFQSILGFSRGNGQSKYSISFQADNTLDTGGRTDNEDYQKLLTTETYGLGIYHIVSVLDVGNETSQVYVDGVSQTMTGSINFNNSILETTEGLDGSVGATVSGSGYFNGIIYDIKVYDTILTTLQAEDIYVREGN